MHFFKIFLTIAKLTKSYFCCHCKSMRENEGVTGVLMLSLGVSVYTYYQRFSFIYPSAIASIEIKYPSPLFIFYGCSLVLLSCIGFLSMFRGCDCGLFFFLPYTLILLAPQIIHMIHLPKILDSKQLASYIYVPIDEYPHDCEIQAEVNALQVELKCCGEFSYTDYCQLWTLNYNDTVMYEDEVVDVRLPRSCCEHVLEDNVTCAVVHNIGCKIAFLDIVYQNLKDFTMILAFVMPIEVMTFISVLLYTRSMHNNTNHISSKPPFVDYYNKI